MSGTAELNNGVSGSEGSADQPFRPRHGGVVCTVCGRPFVAVRSDARHCSRRCRQAAWRRQRSAGRSLSRRRRCPRCGRIFVAARTDGVYCSNACRQAMHRRRARRTGAVA